MSLIKTPAIVLSSRHLGEADKLVTLFTHRLGKITGAAKGARRIKSRFGSALEPFTHCQVILFQKSRDSLYRIQQADILQSFRELREDLDRILWTSRVATLTSAMVPEADSNPALFDLLLETLHSLRGKNVEITTRLFEIRLLRQAGYQPRLEAETCLSCRAKLDPTPVLFSPGHGGIVCRACGGEKALATAVTRGTVALIRQALKMPPGLASRIKATDAMKEELKNLLEAYFDHLLDKR